MSIDQGTFKGSPTRSTSRSMISKPSAHTMQRQLQQSTKALQIEKRRNLQLEEEIKKTMKQFSTEKDQLNELLRATHSNSVTSLPIKASNLLHSTNKVHSENETVVAQIRELRDQITLLRRERVKHMKMADKLNQDLKEMEHTIQETDTKIDGIKQTNDFIKTQILEYRNRTITDIKDFKSSFNSLTQNYFTERKFFDGQLRKSRNRQTNDIQTNALPIMKERLRKLIYKNSQKMKIANDFKKACNQISRMFAIMRDYKGKDDIQFIAHEFVQKQNMIDKLEEYIDQLESRIEILKLKKGTIEGESGKIQQQLEKVDGKLGQKRGRREQAEILKRDIKALDDQMKGIQINFDTYAPTFQQALIQLRESKFNREGDIPEQIRINFSVQRSSLRKILGEMEKYIVLIKPPITKSPTQISLKDKDHDDEGQKSNEKLEAKQQPRLTPPQDTQTIKQQLLNYDRLREIAAEIISRKSNIIQEKKDKKKS